MTGFVIPIKELKHTKTRLGGQLCLEEREMLCLHMAKTMLQTAASCAKIHRIYCISPQEDLKDLLDCPFPVTYICSQEDKGLNCAVKIAAKRLLEDGCTTMIFLHGDLPFVKTSDLDLLCEKSAHFPVVLIPDLKEEGTNGLVLTPPDVMETAFGAGSLKKHLELCKKNGLTPCLVKEYGISQDIDQPCDLAVFQAAIASCSGSGKP